MIEGIEVAEAVVAMQNGTMRIGRTEGLPIPSAAQQRALGALLTQPNTVHAAKAAQVGLRTLRGWLAEDRNFIAHHRVNCRVALGKTIAKLQDRAPAIADSLYEMANDPKVPARARVMAARSLLSFALREAKRTHVQEPLTEITTKLDAIERRKKGSAPAPAEAPVPAPAVAPAPAEPEAPKALSALQERAVLALVEHRNLAAVATGAGLRTLRDWRRNDANFQSHYRNAVRETFAQTVKQAQDRVPVLVERVCEIAFDKLAPSTARMRALQLLLDVSRQGASLMEEADAVEGAQADLIDAACARRADEAPR